MASLSSPPDLDLPADVLREIDPDPLRLILWLPGDEEVRCRHWRRVSGHFLGGAAPAEGLHAIPVRVAAFREDFRGEVRRLFDRFWAGRGQAAARFILPTGEWVEPEGEPRDDALLAWAEAPAAAPDDDRLAELWPGHESCLRLGPNAVLVVGVVPPARPERPAVVPAAPPNPAACRPRLTSGVADAEFAGQFRERRRRVKELIHRGHEEEALAEARGLLDLARQRWFDGHPAVGTCLLVLAVVHHGRGEGDLAERLYREVLDIYCPELGDNHPNFATGLNNLALLYQARGHEADAEPLFRQALDIRLASMGDLHALTGASMHNLALLLHARGDTLVAESLLLQALHVFRHTFGEGHPDVATCLDGLAALYQHVADDGTASILIGQADQARLAAAGKEQVRVADTLNLLGELTPVRSESAVTEDADRPAVATVAGAGLDADPLSWLMSAATTELPDDTPAPAGLAVTPDEPAGLPLLMEEAAAEGEAPPAVPIDSGAAPAEETPADPVCAEPAEEWQPAEPVAAVWSPEAESLADTPAPAPPVEAMLPEGYALLLDEPFLILEDADARADSAEAAPATEYPDVEAAAVPTPAAEPVIAVPVDRTEVEQPPEPPAMEGVPAEFAFALPEPLASESYPVAIPVLPVEATLSEQEGATSLEFGLATGAFGERRGLPPPSSEMTAGASPAARSADLEAENEPYPVAVPVLPDEDFHAAAAMPAPAETIPAETDDASAEVSAETAPHQPDERTELPPAECASEAVAMDAADAIDALAEALAYSSVASEPVIPEAESELPLSEAAPFPADETVPGVSPGLLDGDLPGIVCATAWPPETPSILISDPLDDPALPPASDPPTEYADTPSGSACDLTPGESECAAILPFLAFPGRDETHGEHPAATEVPPPPAPGPDGGTCLARAAAGRAAEAIALLQQALARGYSSAAPELLPADEPCGMPPDLALFLSLVCRHPAAVPGAVGAALDFVLRHRAMPLHGEPAEGDRREVARRLPAGSALVEFIRFPPLDLDGLAAGQEPTWLPPRYVAFVLPAGAADDTTLVDLGEASGTDHLVADCRARLVDRPNGERAAPAWRPAGSEGRALRATTALRRAVFDPLTAALGDRARLFLAPVGSLACLPFEVLTHPDGRTLLDSHTISYVASGLDILGFGAEPEGQPGPSVVAVDPDFDLFLAPGPRSFPDAEGAAGRFPRLAGARRAGKQFAALLGVEPWRAASVRKGRLLAVRSPRVLHLGTHCVLNEEGAWLAVAGANGADPAWPQEAEDNGLLSAGDVAGLDLGATQLVVLPACDTAGADTGLGERLLGLRRAFQAAGAAAVVSSLWKVTDWHAKELLSDFYERVLAGEPRAEALRQAQLALRERYPDHPEYWGAFVCQGDPGPLPPAAGRAEPASKSARPRWRWADRRRAVAAAL